MQEIERKFLVDPKKWNPQSRGVRMKQGYLSVDPERVVRVRVAGEKSFLTVKGNPKGISRTEIEFEISRQEAEELMKLCLDFVVEKTRYKQNVGGFIWEIDRFEGLNQGLLLAEIELQNENQLFEMPEWIEKEVSLDPRFFNASLSQHPFTRW
ncbi:MAG: CYTH domain-containing protein [Prolixibacteraceae bacterium]|nr:CYTH domain-containing protein [Prolixibacteraceae bacterium]